MFNISTTKPYSCTIRLKFGDCELRFICYLGLVYWNLSFCHRSSFVATKEATLESTSKKGKGGRYYG
jgi:hypothetical protein